MILVLLSLLLVVPFALGYRVPDWSHAFDAVQAGVSAKAFPGAVAAIIDYGHPELGELNPLADMRVAIKSFGRQTYDPASAAVTVDTLWDLASVTKVVASTSAAMLLYQLKVLDLDMAVADASLLGANFTAGGKAGVKVRHLLEHSAGFPPDPSPNYWAAAFGCPATAVLPNPPLDFSCREKILLSLMNQPLANPVGAKYVYSDLSMITLMYVIGRVAARHDLVVASDADPNCPLDPASAAALPCFYEAFVRLALLGPAGMAGTLFNPPASAAKRCAPAWKDDVYQKRLIQGTVSDGNAYALGGIAGHAGLFSGPRDLVRFVWRLANSPEHPRDELFSNSTVSLFTTVVDAGFSSRALGWDTMAASSTYAGCLGMSAATYTHTGYTGTQICVDPVRKLATVLLTNRVYPDDSAASSKAIKDVRQRFSTLVVKAQEDARRPERRRNGWLYILLAAVVGALSIVVIKAVVTFIKKRRSLKESQQRGERSLQEVDNSFSPLSADDDMDL